MLLRIGIISVAAVLACGTVLEVAPSPVGAQTPAPVQLPAEIPLFPLQDVVLFPHASRPLHIFEPRYRAMVADALATDRVIGMVLLRPGYEDEYEGRPPIFPIGCAGTIVEIEELPDGRYNLVLDGLTKFRVIREDHSRPYRVGTVEPLPDRLTDAARRTLHRRRIRLEELLASLAPPLEPPPTMPAERLVDTVALILDFTPTDRQTLLELDDPLARAEAIIERLAKRLSVPL